MVWQLTAPQCFFIAIIVFGIWGMYRGWRREVISLAFLLGAILFLFLTRSSVAQFVFVNLPRAIQELTTGTTPTEPVSTIPISDPRSTLAIAIFFIAMVFIGYLVSNRAMPKASTPSEHILGVIPGLVEGYAILNFVTNALGATSLFTFNVAPPGQSQISSGLLVIFIVAVVAILVSLIAASTKKKGGAAPPKKP